jgi:hypothetical protein
MTASFLVLSSFGEETPHSIATSPPEENSGLSLKHPPVSCVRHAEACEHG